MNTDQVNSLIRSLFKIIGAGLIAHGMTDAASIVNNQDVIGLVLTLVGLLSSYNWHKDPTKPAAGGGAGSAPLVLFCLALTLAGFGCVATNPDHTAGAPAYIIAPSLSNNLATAQTIANTAAPIAGALVPAAAPFAPFISGGTYALGGLITLLSGLLVTYRNQAAKQKAAAAALAATIPSSNHAQALSNAATNGSTAAVAEALTASQSPT